MFKIGRSAVELNRSTDPSQHTAYPTFHILHSGSFNSTDEPALVPHHHPKSIVCITFTLGINGQIYTGVLIT